MRELINSYTDEEIASDESLFKDGDGVWKLIGGFPSLIEPSQEWFDKNRLVVEQSEPTQEERILALEQALLDLLG